MILYFLMMFLTCSYHLTYHFKDHLPY